MVSTNHGNESLSGATVHQEKNNTKSMLSSSEDKKQKLETRKKLEAAVIRISSSRTGTQVDDLKRLDDEFERKFDEIKSEKMIEQNRKARSLDKEIPDELGLPMPHPAFVVETKGAAESDQGQNIEAPIEPQCAGSETVETTDCAASNQVEQSTYASGVELSAGVTASVPSLLNNGTGQSAVQPVPQILFRVFDDPFLHELEKLQRESENSKKTFEEKVSCPQYSVASSFGLFSHYSLTACEHKSILKAELERKMAEKPNITPERQSTKIEASKNLVIMNKLIRVLRSCPNVPTRRHLPQQLQVHLAQRAAQVNALRNYTAPAPAPAALQLQSSLFPTPALALLQLQASSFPAPALLQPQASSFTSSVSRPSGLPLNSTVCPMPQPRQPLISNTAPTPSDSPATNQIANASLHSPAPHLSSYRPAPSVPVDTATLTLSLPPQALTYSAVLIQQQQEQQPQQSLSSGLQGNNDVVCLSDDE
ncbi:predicted protein [Arabidopsis lyrata subsp. lyrata]|uniref:Predicted protein n=1 Tax=Arabidopsis lyrata subsp. lyrata TaxID=81972 RepID=D7KID2_ARALL|nr:predicted protein [Arabidopsis lyrata subsp. lyrata]